MTGDLDSGQPPTQEPAKLPSSQRCGVWPSKAKLGPAAASTASAYHTVLQSANYLLNPLQAQKTQVTLSPRFLRRSICYQWNDTSSPTCSYPNCWYDHICYICAMSPTARCVDHKALYCHTRRQITNQSLDHYAG